MRYTDDELLAVLPHVLRADKAGRLFWLRRPVSMFNGKDVDRICASWNARFAGKEAINTLRPDGYLGGQVLGRMVLAHCVVWALIFGRWPTGDLDHKNHIGSDNRPWNLRETTHQDNGRNCRRSVANTSGVTGVSQFRGKWQAHITVDGRKQHLGTFKDFAAAVAAREAANREYGFHPNHGLAA